MGIVAAHPRPIVHMQTRPTGGGDVTAWSVPRSIPGFNTPLWRPQSDQAKALARRQFVGLMGVAIYSARRGVRSGGFSGVRLGQVPPPGCYPLGDGTCQTQAFGPVGCNLVRECDPMTGQVHFEYALPGGNANADINVVSDTTGQVVGYNDANSNFTTNGPIAVGTQIVNPNTGAIVYNPAPALSQSPTGGGSATQTPGSTSNAPATGAPMAATVQLTNVSRPGSPLQVGDKWALKITGAPNGAVVGTATHNGISAGSTNFGNTDSTGQQTLTGQMTADTIGTWVESWTVAGGPAASLQFTVVAAPAAPAPAPSPGNTTGGGGSTPTDTTTGTLPPATSTTVAGFSLSNIPGWALAAAGIAAAFLIFGGKR